MAERDKLNREKCFPEYKKLSKMCEKLKKEYFQKLIERDNNIATVWRALNVFTKGQVFLDLKKAFDLIDHDILLKKLAIYLKNSSALPFFKSYLYNRTQCVLLHGSYSSKESVKYGVPQGSVLGPICF